MSRMWETLIVAGSMVVWCWIAALLTVEMVQRYTAQMGPLA